MFDILIKDGTIIDGTGSSGFRGSVAIEGEILYIITGDTSSLNVHTTIDASNFVIAPGFIDVHSHSDLMALAEPANECKIRQGITTDFIGGDGIGYAPLSPKNLPDFLLYFSGLNGYPEIRYNWSSVKEYLNHFLHRTSINVAFLIPNGCLRLEAIGWENRAPTDTELKSMQSMIIKGMEEGAVGLSSGLSYIPSMYADTAELVSLCKTVAECGGVYVTHVRYDLGDGMYDGFKEAIDIGEKSGCPIHINHYNTNLQTKGQTSVLKMLVDHAIDKGIDVTYDSYPWEAGASTLHMTLPDWMHTGGPNHLIRRLKDSNMREKLLKQGTDLMGPINKLLVSAVKTDDNKWCEGLTLAEVAKKRGRSVIDTICDLLIEEDLEVTYTCFIGDIEDAKAMVNHPVQMFCTDGIRLGDKTHPRTYGTYAKVLGEIVREDKILSIEEAIRKMTSFPAQRFGLKGRGLIRNGMKSDIVVFDRHTIGSNATYDDPKQHPSGIKYIIVNGEVVINNGQYTGALSGQPLNCHS